MVAWRLALVAGLAQIAAFSLAGPVPGDSPLSLSARRQQACSNIPSVVAGTKTPKYPTSPKSRGLPPTILSRRFPPGQITFCASDCYTFNVFQSITDPDYGVLQSAMLSFLNAVYHDILDRIARGGDGSIQFGGMFIENTEVTLQIYLGNANNHQLTWGVAAASAQAMATFMQQAGAGPLAWQIWDGMNRVGIGGIAIYRRPPPGK